MTLGSKTYGWLAVSVASALLMLGLPAGAFADVPALSSDRVAETIVDKADPQLIDNQDPALLAEMRRQEKLHPAAQRLNEAAVDLPADSGFAGVSYVGDEVVLHYKGSLPNAMAAAVGDARLAAAVEVKAAPYSRFELESAQARLMAAVEREHAEVQAIIVAGDGSGLSVERMAPTVAADMRRAVAEKGVTTRNIDDLLKELTLDVPITVSTAAGPIEFLSSRDNDTSPFNGGGRYITFRNGEMRNSWCTTGFGVTKGSTSYVLTADHCMSAPDVAYNAGYLEPMGPVYQSNWDKDILLINARGSVLIFDGGPVSTYKKTVHSWGYRVNGELLCTSGSKTGVICGDKTSADEVSAYGCDSDNDCFWVHDLARAVNINGQCVGVGGDSGGPVFSLDGDGVRAKGVISGRETNNCTVLTFQDMDEIVGAGWIPRTA